MGGGASKKLFDLEMQIPETVDCMKKLKLSDKDVKLLWKSFSKMDKNRTGTISVEEYMNYYHFDKSNSFSKFVFATVCWFFLLQL